MPIKFVLAIFYLSRTFWIAMSVFIHISFGTCKPAVFQHKFSPLMKIYNN